MKPLQLSSKYLHIFHKFFKGIHDPQQPAREVEKPLSSQPDLCSGHVESRLQRRKTGGRTLAGRRDSAGVEELAGLESSDTDSRESGGYGRRVGRSTGGENGRQGRIWPDSWISSLERQMMVPPHEGEIAGSRNSSGGTAMDLDTLFPSFL